MKIDPEIPAVEVTILAYTFLGICGGSFLGLTIGFWLWA